MNPLMPAGCDGFALHEIVCDDGGMPVTYRFLEVNPGFEQLTGLKATEVLGRTVDEVLPGTERHWVEAYGKVALEGRAMHFENYSAVLDRHYEVFAYSPQQGQFACVFFDVTARRRAEAELQAANQRLAEAERRKDEFLAMLAHELRNPMAPIRNAVQVLRLTGPNDEKAGRQQDIIERQVVHLTHLLDDLLDVSRVTRGKIALHKHPVHLDNVLTHAIEVASPIIQARRHHFEFRFPADELCLEGDLDRLTQAIANLLVNAAKYTHDEGRIRMEAVREEGQAVIRISDTGIGIDPQVLPHIFDLFAQADHALARTGGGLGIGLTLARSLIQMHGGTIEAASDGPGHGSQFTIRLPLLAIREAAQFGVDVHDPAKGKTEPEARRVLVVDDMIDSASTLADLITLWGYDVRVANSGLSALKVACEFMPEVVLLDIGMPGMDGYEVARHLRRQFGSGMLIVAQTGYGQQQDRDRAAQAGFDEHLVKPVEIKALCQLLGARRQVA